MKKQPVKLEHALFDATMACLQYRAQCDKRRGPSILYLAVRDAWYEVMKTASAGNPRFINRMRWQ